MLKVVVKLRRITKHTGCAKMMSAEDLFFTIKHHVNSTYTIPIRVCSSREVTNMYDIMYGLSPLVTEGLMQLIPRTDIVRVKVRVNW